MSDADKTIANSIWRSWTRGPLAFWFLLFAMVGWLFIPDDRPHERPIPEEKKTCTMLTWTEGPGRREAWETLVGAGWNERGNTLTEPGCEQ